MTTDTLRSDAGRITADDILAACQLPPEAAPPGFAADAAARDLSFREATVREVEAWSTMVLERMLAPRARRTETENQEAFERGWRENLETALAGGITSESLRPRYFRDASWLRYGRRLIVTGNPQLEFDLFSLVRRLIFHRYLSDCDAVHEYGCGSCGNLLLIAEMFSGKRLHGYDWAQASVEIAELIAARTGMRITGSRLDMRHPPAGVPPAARTAVLTVHALEQIGQDFQPLIDHFLASRPVRVVHLEPTIELYESTSLYDHLAIEYSRRRGYLAGYLTALEELERQGRIRILAKVRPHIGGVIHEASLIVWEPRPADDRAAS